MALILEKQMIELKYNESNQLRVRLAILESQLKVANDRFEHLKRTYKEKSSRAEPFQVK